MAKDTHIQVRLSRTDKARVLRAAEDEGMKLSDYIRAKLVPAEPLPSETAAAFLDTDDLERAIRRKQAHGLTRPVAEREAKRELSRP